MASSREIKAAKIGAGFCLLQVFAAPMMAQDPAFNLAQITPEINLQDLSKAGQDTAPSAAAAPKLAPALNEIATSKRLEDMDSKLDTPLKQAVREIQAKLKGKDSSDLRADLDWIRTNGSASGQVLASLLLGPGLKALKELPENISVAYYSKGALCHYTVSDIVVDQSSKTPILKLLPQAKP